MSDPQEEGLTQDLPFDMSALIAEVEAQIESEAGDDVLDEDEAGPSYEEGELTDEDLDATEEPLGEDDESDEDGEEDPAEEDDESDEEDLAETPEDAPKAEATDDPRDHEITRLKELVLQTQQQSQQLMDLVLRQQERQQEERQQQSQKAKAAEEYGISEETVELVLFGGPEGSLEKLDPQTRAKAQRFARDWTKEQSRYALDPSKFYQEKIRDLVLADLRQVVGPVVQQQTVREAQAVIDRHLEGLDPKSKQRVAEVFKTLNSPTEDALKFAADYVRKELETEQLAQRERKVETAERQKQANRKAARKGARPKRRAKTSNNQRPRMQPGESPLDYARRLQKFE